ncbi:MULTISPECIES: hypothetical protein [Burkholderia cepacia complex]|uniref:hypothetical protein n=1 Tax=Burkholderia cepacia complex TaxID=87882 RepID=UPI000B11175E|nr:MULTISPECIES: hypothetical protein [Burkholderia cepacia complex]GAU03453.1 hypothetical protein BSLA_02f0383 [Burkholderia stabilis]
MAVNETMRSALYRCRACDQLLKTVELERGVASLSPDDAHEQFAGFDPSKY